MWFDSPRLSLFIDRLVVSMLFVVSLRMVIQNMHEDSSFPKRCHSCGGDQLYSTVANAAGGCGPDLLPGLGGFFLGATFQVVVCRSCGLTQFFASKAALDKLERSSEWRKISD